MSQEFLAIVNRYPFLFIDILLLPFAYGMFRAWVSRGNDRINKITVALDYIARAPGGLDVTLELIVKQMQELTRADGAVVEMIEGDELYYRTTGGALITHQGFRMKYANSLSGTCIEQKAVLVCKDSETDKRVNREACREVGVRSMIVAPLFYMNDVVGVLKVASGKRCAFGKSAEMDMKLMAGILGSAISQAQDHQRNKQFAGQQGKKAA